MPEMKPPDLEERRDERERRSLFLEEWRLNVDDQRKQFVQWTEISAQFGLTSLRSIIVLNGGALVALPPLMQWLDEAQRQSIFSISLFFVVGVLLSVVSTFIGYLNFNCLAQLSDARASIRAMDVNNQYSPNRKPLDELDIYVAEKKRERKYEKLVDVTQVFAVLVGLSALAAFCWGVFEFMSLVELNAEGETPK